MSMSNNDTTLIGTLKRYALAGKPPDARTATILVVDDEESVLKFIERVLRDEGYDIHVATSGSEALAKAATIQELSLLVTDMMMPSMNGDEVARLLRQREPSLKVLYLTGFSERLFKEKQTLWADEAYLDKPCSVKGLRQAVSLLLYGKVVEAADVPA
jgi:two-component system cell cycle sensor histidine kinase/response regulator CckA